MVMFLHNPIELYVIFDVDCNDCFQKIAKNIEMYILVSPYHIIQFRVLFLCL